ncbi:prepilin peptidase [Alkalicoccobacillus murimartini]|uniref:Prepilin leader peptidase/N-methyltransferase n=1 Tax=Alkalicoccobacillus murimartini TaxID=171685 RepID=A0ABT9YJI0_9BACI|nr:A24 family peptidase [Alkalicoccobacillus murimartini]MDQ0208009.1 leader peptidase (prepilin peptidase)/N-methyltransferase [Alkalicoccobacillus murimartini]
MIDSIMVGYLAVVGLVFGSFYNVVGLRVPVGASIVKPRSHCSKCERTLEAKELIPVFSFLVQGGSCRTCDTKISFLYPTTELMTGILFALSFYLLGWSPETIVALLLVSLLAIIFVSDMRYMLIPDKVLLFFTVPLILMRVFVAPLTPWWDAWFGALLGFGLLLLIAIISRGGMGGGDIKLFAVLGLVLGWKMVLLTLFLASTYGAIFGGGALLLRKVKRKQAIPFGPFIAAGALTAYFFGNDLIRLYIELVLY